MGRTFASGKYAIAICDRCGLQFKYSHLRRLTSDGRPNGLRVCRDCWEPDHPQEDLGKRPIHDPQALRHARPDPSLAASRETVGSWEDTLKKLTRTE